MDFNQSTDDASRSLKNLINWNKGAWKSTKQRKFASEKIFPSADFHYPRDAQNALLFGIQLQEGQKGLILEGSVRWADYGRKSVRRVAWFYVLDDVGVVAQYKLKFSYSSDGCFSEVNPNGTTKIWERPEGVEAPVEPPPPIVIPTFHVGKIGDKVPGFLTLIKTVYIEKTFEYGSSTLSIFNDSKGNKFFSYGTIRGYEEDLQKGFDCVFTVKDHIVSKSGENITIIKRVTPTKEQKALWVLMNA